MTQVRSEASAESITQYESQSNFCVLRIETQFCRGEKFEVCRFVTWNVSRNMGMSWGLLSPYRLVSTNRTTKSGKKPTTVKLRFWFLEQVPYMAEVACLFGKQRESVWGWNPSIPETIHDRDRTTSFEHVRLHPDFCQYFCLVSVTSANARTWRISVATGNFSDADLYLCKEGIRRDFCCNYSLIAPTEISISSPESSAVWRPICIFPIYICDYKAR